MTAEAREIMVYLKKHNLADQLNVIVNKLCKKRSEDPFGFLASRLHHLAAASVITKVEGREVLGASGTPALQVDLYCKVDDSAKFVARGTASAPAPGSEEVEGDAKWYAGSGLRKAVSAIDELIHSSLGGLEPSDQASCDQALASLSKGKIGPSAANASSIAVCKAGAALSAVECFEHIHSLMYPDSKTQTFSLPSPLVQLIDGSAPSCKLLFREVLAVPMKKEKKGATAAAFQSGLQTCATLHAALGKTLASKYGTISSSAAALPTQSGGYAPPLSSLEDVLKVIEDAASAAGLALGEDVGLVIRGGEWSEGYCLKPKDKPKEVEDVVDYYLSLAKDYSWLAGLIDPLKKEDSDALDSLCKSLGEDAGLSSKNVMVISSGTGSGSSIGTTINVDQLLTVSAGIKLALAAKNAGSPLVVTAASRWGTEENFAADFAVGVGAKYVKFGGTAGSQNVGKYNRLLQIKGVSVQ
eukprot:CAMPEP_0197515702 /NCGR_PEP_ID=MMETSP1318-20131121/751_1 /TAXON_ID=552666 /ORGANISM="Partenskyella glossopodia, Strain RCC365" /LENGTH=469 /DNA_ID=CAMNT_0043064149 /DNA_START=45 /DNA_END=1454 /DNA_ORIENTATION=-